MMISTTRSSLGCPAVPNTPKAAEAEDATTATTNGRAGRDERDGFETPDEFGALRRPPVLENPTRRVRRRAKP
jgi:hypothetical protein